MSVGSLTQSAEFHTDCRISASTVFPSLFPPFLSVQVTLDLYPVCTQQLAIQCTPSWDFTLFKMLQREVDLEMFPCLQGWVPFLMQVNANFVNQIFPLFQKCCSQIFFLARFLSWPPMWW
mmetsp:Transcript_46757/g.78500  ORF Transcript_46757/g.78500 Transcript_46757/m.78500 type:complete len:120 (+) Transcript_46757:354-713(+)